MADSRLYQHEEQVESIFPERCENCKELYSYAHGRTYAIYLCGSEHTSKGWKHSYACQVITQLKHQLNNPR